MAERESDQVIKDRQDAELEAERHERRTRLGHVVEEAKPKPKPKAKKAETKEVESEA